MKAHYLGHVVFYVREMKRSLAFYRNVLGFELVGEMKHPLNAVALTSGRTHHEILLIEVGAAPPPQKGHRLGLYHIGIKMGDSLDELQTVRNELNEAGVFISGMSNHTVSQSLYLEDPDGNEVELYVDDPSVDWKKDPAAVVATIKPLRLM